MQEYAGLCALQLGLFQTYAEIGDRAGTGYALRKAAASIKAEIATYNEVPALDVEGGSE